MAKLSDIAQSSGRNVAGNIQQLPEDNKQKIQEQQEQYQQLQRDLADAISRLASLDDIRILLACGAKVDGPVTQGLHPIHYAAYQNFVPAVRLLILRGCDINAMDDNGYTPVHLCAERGYYELLEFLIASGAKVRFTDLKMQGTINSLADEPLSLALKKDHRNCAELLLKNGADPNAKYFMGSEINLVGILKVSYIKLLLEHGANPDSRDRSGLTPLMRAARHPHGYATVKLLIQYGADVNDIAGERHDYRTVLHHSIFSGNLDLIKLLLMSGARYPKLDFDKPSPMDIAIISGRHDIAELLINSGAEINGGCHTTIGQPLHTALTQRVDNKYELVELLLSSGADPNSSITSSRNTGPPLSDYLNSVHVYTGGWHLHPPSIDNSSNHCVGAADINMVRLLLIYGAKVILKVPSQHPLGLLRTLERVQDELSLELLHLLADAAEQVDWSLMCKIIYSHLRHNNRRRTNELFDPSVSTDMTPERLCQLLAEDTNHDPGLCESLIKLMNNGRSSTNMHSLKQLSRIKLRNYLTDGLKLKGSSLMARLVNLPLPSILIRYMLYQH